MTTSERIETPPIINVAETVLETGLPAIGQGLAGGIMIDHDLAVMLTALWRALGKAEPGQPGQGVFAGLLPEQQVDAARYCADV